MFKKSYPHYFSSIIRPLIPPWLECDFSNNKQLIGLKYSYNPQHNYQNEELKFFTNKCEERFKEVIEKIIDHNENEYKEI